MGRQRRARRVAHVHELGRLRDRRVAPSGGRRGTRRRAGAGAGAAGVDPRPRRARGLRERGARQRDLVAHLRLRRHASRHDHPPRRSGRLRRARPRRAPGRDGPAAPRRARGRHRRRVPRGQRDLPRSLRPRLAHHRLDRNARRRRGRGAPPRSRCAAHHHGDRHRRLAADRRPGAVRIDDEALSRRRLGPRGTHRPRSSRGTASRRPSARSKRRAG